MLGQRRSYPTLKAQEHGVSHLCVLEERMALAKRAQRPWGGFVRVFSKLIS